MQELIKKIKDLFYEIKKDEDGIYEDWGRFDVMEKVELIIREYEKKVREIKKKREFEKSKIADEMFSNMRRENINRQEENLAKAYSNDIYKNLIVKKSYLEIKYTTALANGDKNNMEKYFSELKEIDKQVDQVLASIGLTKDMLKIKYNCEKCEDTGFNKMNGKRCDCFFKLINSL